MISSTGSFLILLCLLENQITRYPDNQSGSFGKDLVASAKVSHIGRPETQELLIETNLRLKFQYPKVLISYAAYDLLRHICNIFLSDPGVPGVRSMGPDVSN